MSDKLEQELKKALRRVEPPESFAERVLARAAEEEKPSAPLRPWPQWLGVGGLRWVAASALRAALAISGFVYHLERQKQGEEAKEQLMLALRITSSKLQIAAEGVQQMNSPEGNQP